MRPQRNWPAKVPSRNKQNIVADRSDWVGSSLLTAMDRMEGHVKEMLSTIAAPAQAPPPPAPASVADTVAIKSLIKKEVARRVEDNVGNNVDVALNARLQHLKTAQKLDCMKIEALQTRYDRHRRTLDDLDALHRHEYVLNSALVERLFEVPSLKGDADARFEETTVGLQGTDSVNSVLVSHIEALVVKVEGLERKVEGLQRLLEMEE